MSGSISGQRWKELTRQTLLQLPSQDGTAGRFLRESESLCTEESPLGSIPIEMSQMKVSSMEHTVSSMNVSNCVIYLQGSNRLGHQKYREMSP